MKLNQALTREKTKAWEAGQWGYSLPAWDEFPTLSLYMDQVIYLLNQYLAPASQEREDKRVTAAMINNYVKLKIIPPPVKKRYERTHLAWLTMVCVLKQSLTTGEIKKLLPLTLATEKIQEIYADFIHIYQEESAGFQDQLNAAAALTLSGDFREMNRLVFRASASADLFQSLAEDLLCLYPESETEKHSAD